MKILINAFSARQGGGQTYLVNLLNHVSDEVGLEVEVFAPSQLTLPDHPNIRRVQTQWPTNNPILRAIWEYFVLPKYLKKNGVNILFCPGGLVVPSTQRSILTVTMFRNMTPFDVRALNRMPWGLQRIRNHLLRWLMLRSMRNANLTIFISSFARGVIERLIVVPRGITIPHGIPDGFRGQPDRIAVPSFIGVDPYILYVSKIDSYKHHEEVVRGYAAIESDLRARFRLVLVGEASSPEAERVRGLIVALGLTDRVLICGEVNYNELPSLYQNAEINLFASSCENCPNILLESLAAGRPVLASNVEPMPEFGGSDIGYFSPFDPASIAHAITSVLRNPEISARYAAAALERSTLYDWRITARQTWHAIQTLGNE